MPPIFMIVIVVFAVLMVMFGRNPIEEMRKEQLKYGTDPLAREINKFNEKQEKGTGKTTQYKPPAGSTVYRLPPGEAVIQPKNNLYTGENGEQLVRPAPEVPMDQWGSPYPTYMVAPRDKAQDSNNALPNRVGGGTSLLPGRAPGAN